MTNICIIVKHEYDSFIMSTFTCFDQSSVAVLILDVINENTLSPKHTQSYAVPQHEMELEMLKNSTTFPVVQHNSDVFEHKVKVVNCSRKHAH